MNMKRETVYNGIIIEYDLQYKKVKNINLRVMPDGSVKVSANKRVSAGEVDRFVLSIADRIIKAKEKFARISDNPCVQYRTESELKSMISEMCRGLYPYFESRGVEYPAMKFRKMISRWGSCNSAKGIVTFSTQLIYVPEDCVEYVVMHEFTHFLQPNHSKKYYEELSKICPRWKEIRKKLKNINPR